MKRICTKDSVKICRMADKNLKFSSPLRSKAAQK